MNIKNKQYKLTIITVCFNSETTIEKTIKSVLSQDYKNIEYVIVDGGSKDMTVSIIKKYSKSITWISEKDGGIYDAMNKGLELSNGDFIYFLGSDDVLYNDVVISTIFKKIHHTDSLYYGKVKFLNSGRIFGGKTNVYKLALCNIPHQAIIYPKNVFIQNKYNIRYRLYADYDLNIKCFSLVEFIYMGDVLAIYNEDGASSIRDDVDFMKDKDKIIKLNLGITPLIYWKLRKNINKVLKRLK